VQDPGRASARTDPSEISFPPFRLDLRAGFLRAGDRTISLRPKTWAVLCYLAQRPGVLVTKDEILDAVWGEVSVTEATLTKSIAEIRDALRDEVRSPRFVETVHRRGFRFVSPVEAPTAVVVGPSMPPPRPPVNVVARGAELGSLRELLAQASQAARQTVFITGEAGIGKTTLVDAFLASVAEASEAHTPMIAKGQCVRRHSGEEPLMPVLEAVARLARGPNAARVMELLRRDAPAWLVQLPWLVDARELAEIRAHVSGTTPERMLRVFAQLVEELTSDTTLVLVLEDLHWADASTVDLVSILAQRPEMARLLLIGTYRSAEAIAYAASFDGMRRVLGQKRCCTEIPLGPLPPSGVEDYLVGRFDSPVPSALVRFLHMQTEGNPLFLVTAVDHLTSQGLVDGGPHGVVLRVELRTLEQHIPGSLRDLVEMQVTDLVALDVSVLEAASVAGLEFGAQTVSGALDVSVEESEDACERLVHAQRFLRSSGTEAWPDGTVAGRYTFAHALYQRVLYHRIPAARRRLLHHRIAERLERGFGIRTPDIAVEVATHFEQGADPTRAIPWLERPGGSVRLSRGCGGRGRAWPRRVRRRLHPMRRGLSAGIGTSRRDLL
jgi:DNA-binding winged helix-turn-helix (wHTH) protein